MSRKVVIVILFILLLLPLALLLIRRPVVNDLLPSSLKVSNKEVSSKRYSVDNQDPNFTIKLVDTTYLDYLTQNMGTFNKNAIVDPRIYKGYTDLRQKFTVTGIRFVLKPMVDPALIMISGKKDFSSRGNFSLDGDTLVIEVSLSTKEFGNDIATTKFAMEDAYLQAAFGALYYSHGLVSMSDSRGIVHALQGINLDIKNYLYSGVMTWPISIERK